MEWREEKASRGEREVSQPYILFACLRGWTLTVTPFSLLITPSYLPSSLTSSLSSLSLSLPPVLPSAHLTLHHPSLPNFSLDLTLTQSPPPLRIPTSLSLSFSISTSLHHTSPHPRPPQPSSSLSVVTAACLMVQLLLSRSTKRRPGERQPRLTPPNRWPYQDWQLAGPRAITHTHTHTHTHTISKIHALYVHG